LEFSVPFQHKYGYIRDSHILRVAINVRCVRASARMLFLEAKRCRYVRIILVLSLRAGTDFSTKFARKSCRSAMPSQKKDWSSFSTSSGWVVDMVALSALVLYLWYVNSIIHYSRLVVLI